MENLEIRIQKTTFDVETQYCDPSDCYHDCTHEGVNNCDAHFTEIWYDWRNTIWKKWRKESRKLRLT